MKTMSRLPAWGLSAAIVLIAFAPVSMALESSTFPFDVTVSCPTEDVYIQGTGRFQMQEVQNANHSTWIFQAFWHGKAWGTSGAEYNVSGRWMEVVQESAPFVMRWNDHFQLAGKNGAGNYRLYWKLRIVVDPNGRPVLDTELGDWECPNA